MTYPALNRMEIKIQTVDSIEIMSQSEDLVQRCARLRATVYMYFDSTHPDTNPYYYLHISSKVISFSFSNALFMCIYIVCCRYRAIHYTNQPMRCRSSIGL